MNPRYQHPEVARLWSEEETYKQWLLVGRMVIQAQGLHGLVDSAVAATIEHNSVKPDDIEEPDVRSIQRIELGTGHDVAAFLQWWRGQLGDFGRFAHLGMTSSDLVDTAMGLRFAQLETHYWHEFDRVQGRLGDMVRFYAQTPALGFTHGQPAEPTTLGIRAQQWYGMVTRAANRLHIAWGEMRLAKLSGPVGTYAHNPPEVERMVALALGLRPHGPGASQVVPRDRLAHWASCAAQLVQALGKMAVDYRLMAARGEVMEQWPEERVGSSAMPHKRNPVTAEKLSGLGRLAAGYAAMLQPVDLWDERDISHSSVERVAVPDLLHVLFHALKCAADLASSAWNEARMHSNLTKAGRLPYTAWRMRGMLGSGSTPEQARRDAQIWAEHAAQPFAPAPLKLVRNHPLVADKRPLDPPATPVID